jgi:hypothetical protein
MVHGTIICIVFNVLVSVKLHQVIGKTLQADNDIWTIASQAVRPAKNFAISFLLIFIFSVLLSCGLRVI